MGKRPQFLPRHIPATPEQFNALRIAAKMTVSELAKALEVATASVENWSQGRTKIPAPIFKLTKIICGQRIWRLNKKAQSEPGEVCR